MTDQSDHTDDVQIEGEVLTAYELADRLLSDRVVAATLAAQGPATYQEISDATGIPTRTVKDAVRRLREDDLATTEKDPTNPRGTRHRLTLWAER
ncbi:helix-turn-helix domain-containing protein [Halosimplex halophilum]|uniref:helix-turn-helix domain-containing protein n=1 Tax=Halosimplex halophilum TaxID=2559572 RepID=UPI00107F7122|nr:helix-turn-helix domain-containing protein [Halosimplex halophilum]